MNRTTGDWNFNKRSNFHVIGVQKGKEKSRLEKIFKEVMTENFLNLAKDKNS